MFDSLYAQEPARKDNSEPWLLSYSDLITNLFVFFAFLLSISMINRHRLETITNYFREKPKYSLMDLKNQIDAIIKKNKLEDKISTAIGVEGLEIDFSHSLLFNSGESVLLPEAKPHISLFTEKLQSIDPRWQFVVEGHTDDIPIHTPLFPSNWELSAYRGMEFLNFLRSHGIHEERIQLRGHAHTKPKYIEKKENGEFSDAARTTNRRVTLKIY